MGTVLLNNGDGSFCLMYKYKSDKLVLKAQDVIRMIRQTIDQNKSNFISAKQRISREIIKIKCYNISEIKKQKYA